MRSKVRQIAVLVTSAAAAMAFAIGTGIAPASAATGYGLDGTLPDGAGSYCMNGASVIYSTPIRVGGTGAQVGTMQIRYSSSCGTNWVRAENESPYLQTAKSIYRDPSPTDQWVHDTDFTYGWSYSRQIYAPGATCIHADVIIDNFYAWAGANIC